MFYLKNSLDHFWIDFFLVYVIIIMYLTIYSLAQRLNVPFISLINLSRQTGKSAVSQM